MWKFQVDARMEKSFKKVYGPDGDWARLFAQDESYVGTELIHASKNGASKAGASKSGDSKGVRMYVTLDFWTSQESYDEFRKRHLANYKALDEKCREMTKSEREIGRFVRVLNK
jgi:hypothetical protein